MNKPQSTCKAIRFVAERFPVSWRSERMGGFLLAPATLLALAVAVTQWAPGARFSETGERLTSGLPLELLPLSVAILAVCLWRGRIVPPSPSRWQSVFFIAALLGLLGLERGRLPSAMPSVVQLGVHFFAVPYAVRHMLARNERGGGLLAFFAVTGLLLPILYGGGFTAWWAPNLSATKYAVFVALAAPFLAAAVCLAYRPWKGLGVVFHGLLVGATFVHGGLLIAWSVGVCGVALLSANGRAKIALFAACAVAIGVSFFPVPSRGGASPWEVFNWRYDSAHVKRVYIDGAAALLAPRHYPFGGGLGRYRETINLLKQYRTWLPHADDFTVPQDGSSHILVLLVEAGIPAALALPLLLAASGLTRARRARAGPVDAKSAIETAAAMAFFAALVAAPFALILSRGTGLWLGALLGVVGAGGGKRQTDGNPWASSAAIAFAFFMIGGLAFVYNLDAPGSGVPSVANQWAAKMMFGDDPGVWRTLPRVDLPDLLTDASGGGENRGFQVEAEAARQFTPDFTRIVDPDASGGAALAIPLEAVKGRGVAVYDLADVPAGEYELYARLHWQDGCSNSIRFRFGEQIFVLTSDVYRTWHVLAARRRLRLEEPVAEGVVENLETGVRIDYWGLRRVDGR